MAIRANITSVEAIESFRANLIVYLSKAKPCLEEANAEIVRTRIWLQTVQRVHWEGVHKKCLRDLEEAKAALFSSKLSKLREISSAEQLAVTKAKRKLDEAEAKLRIIRRWDREFENLIEPMSRKLEKMQVVLMDDLQNAVVSLAQTVEMLDAYARVTTSSVGDGSSPSGSSSESKSAANVPETVSSEKKGDDA
ncbi:MAG TPA: hypothetical protein VG754_08115 [Verrucomicrobiae bacterium]|nr:hypothetical protein [Verrucomicrobiae bacterium]